MQYISQQQQQQWILELIFKKQRENFEIFGRNFRQMNNTQVLGHMAAAYYISIGYWTAQNCESLYLVHLYFPLEEAIHRVFYYFNVSLKKKSEAKKIFMVMSYFVLFPCRRQIYKTLGSYCTIIFFPNQTISFEIRQSTKK